MSNSKFSRVERHSKPRSRRRRPTGVSRRQQRSNLGFETLEDRRVMSANSPVAPLETLGPQYGPAQFSFSSATPEGQAALLQAELERYALIAANNLPTELRTRSLPTDELFGLQWNLLNVGQKIPNFLLQDIEGKPGEDINYFGARQLGYTGEGVLVAVIDSGVQLDHSDLNIHPTLQFDGIDRDGDASPILPVFNPDFAFTYDPINAHGTSVAGIIAALENGEGTVGIAPGAQIVPIRIVDVGQTTQGLIDSFQYAIQNADITNNSFGPVDGIRQLAAPSAGELFALQNSVFGPNAGRNGLGTIHVFAAGNGAQGLDTASYDGYVNSRYTIAVTGVDHDGEYNNIDGTVTGIAESGPSVLVAAPYGSFALTIGDDTGIGTGIASVDTTDLTGFNVPPLTNGLEVDNDYLEVERDAYTSLFGGTSSAAPQVAGVIALMLEANPNLGWRDVQDILVRSARQNSPTGTLQDGADKATGLEYQSTWITNQIPLFHDPDVFDPQIGNALQFYSPILDPLLTLASARGTSLHKHLAPTPQVMTNGAGFTVSQGRGTNNDQIGYAHGVVDAEVAVRLAEQWTTKRQTLANELSFTTTINTVIPAGGFNNSIAPVHVIDPDGIDMIIPGGLGATGNWQGYYDEYFAANPDFTQFTGPISRGGVLELTVPQINGQDIAVEHIEVALNIAGGASEAQDHLRVTLVSPNGTHSELNHYFIDESFVPANMHQTRGGGPFNLNTGQAAQAPNGQNGVSLDGVDRLSPTPANPNNLVFNFSTNRNWGERSDDAIVFDPTTNEPFITPPGVGGNLYNNFGVGAGIPSSVGDLISQGWQLHFENYSPTAFNLNSVEVIWHGSPIDATTERVSGFVGIDQDQSDTFNYSRMIQQPIQSAPDFTDVDFDPNTLRLGEVQNIVDPNPEKLAPNVTVFAYRDVNADGVVDNGDVLVDQFITGHDGNYFFDLVPDNYIITTDDPRAFDDLLTSSNLLPNYQESWQITPDFFKVWDYDSNLEVPTTQVNGVDTPSAFLDGNNAEVVTGVKNLNFLLDPGPEAPNAVQFGGVIYADLNGDGVFNGNDINMPNIGVFGDVNRNGRLDSGETFVETDLNGQYQFTIVSDQVDVIDIGVISPVDWTVVEPNEGTSTYLLNGVETTLTLNEDSPTYSFFTQPGDILSEVDFAVKPPVASDGSGGSVPTGIILGTVFSDANGNRTRQTNEEGASGITVYIDANNSQSLELGELTAVTNQHGAFVFSEAPAGEHVIRMDGITTPLAQTSPINNLPRTITVNPSGTITNIIFGIANSATLDFGDLPAAYGVTTLGEDGARSAKGVYYLGARIDAEPDGVPSAGAVYDDITFSDDEDGVFVEPLTAGSQAADAKGRLTAIASRSGAFQGWIDFNGDFKFDGPGEQILANFGLEGGSNVVEFALPDFIADGELYARFRFGSSDMGILGFDAIGEVEDYQLTLIPDPNPLVISGDFDGDGDVDGADFLVWQLNTGMTSGASRSHGDADNNGIVNSSDLSVWSGEYGQTTPVALAAAQGSGESSDGDLGSLAASVSSSESNFEAAVSSEFGASSSNSPRMSQPGFSEDLVAGVVDSGIEGTQASGLNLASIASAAQRLTTTANSSNSLLVESEQDFVALNDAGLDQGFAALGQAHLLQRERLELASQRVDELEEEEALALALGEEIDWRLN